MKQFIVMASTIFLGVYIFNLILGNNDESIANTISNVWQSSIESRKMAP